MSEPEVQPRTGREQGGDPVCWLSHVCPACGRFNEDPDAPCEACGSEETWA